MTPHVEKINTLLAEIDGVLSKASPRLLWWSASSEVTQQQRQALENLRHYLMALLQEVDAQGSLAFLGNSQGMSKPLTRLDVSQEALDNISTPEAALDVSQHMLQSIALDLNQLRSSVLGPLQSEVNQLQQQRQGLLNEIRQLERQRQQYGLVQSRSTVSQATQEQLMHDFLQGLMERLQDRLVQQVSQTLTGIQAQSNLTSNVSIEANTSQVNSLADDASLPPLHPAQRFEQMRMLQARADQMMLTLDTTLRVFAETLQQNIQGYQTSLSQSLEKMHGLGQQGEVLLGALMNRLAAQLGDETIGYLHHNAAQFSQPEGLELAEQLTQLLEQVDDSMLPPANALDFDLPYAGHETSTPDSVRSNQNSLRSTVPSLNPPDLDLADLDLEGLNWEESKAAESEETELDELLLQELQLAAETSSSTLPAIVSSGVSPRANPIAAVANTSPSLDSALEDSLPIASSTSGLEPQARAEFDFAESDFKSVNEELDAFYANFFGSVEAEENRGLVHKDVSGEDVPSEDVSGIHGLGDEDQANLQNLDADNLESADHVEPSQDVFSVFETVLFGGTSASSSHESELLALGESIAPEDLDSPVAPELESLRSGLGPTAEGLIQDYSAPAPSYGESYGESQLRLDSPATDPAIEDVLAEVSPFDPFTEAEYADDLDFPPIEFDLKASEGVSSAPVSSPLISPAPVSSSSVSSSSVSASPEPMQLDHPVTTITALTDLLQETGSDLEPVDLEDTSPVSSALAQVVQEPLLEAPAEEAYPPASPEEMLLVTSEAEEVIEAEIDLEPEMLQQLHEDLSSLEDGVNTLDISGTDRFTSVSDGVSFDPNREHLELDLSLEPDLDLNVELEPELALEPDLKAEFELQPQPTPLTQVELELDLESDPRFVLAETEPLTLKSQSPSSQLPSTPTTTLENFLDDLSTSVPAESSGENQQDPLKNPQDTLRVAQDEAEIAEQDEAEIEETLAGLEQVFEETAGTIPEALQTRHDDFFSGLWNEDTEGAISLQDSTQNLTAQENIEKKKTLNPEQRSAKNFEGKNLEGKNLEGKNLKRLNQRPTGQEMVGTWYLGLDISPDGLSAVISNRLSQQIYPLFWLFHDTHDPTNPGPRVSWRFAGQASSRSLGRDSIGMLMFMLGSGLPFFSDQHDRWEPQLKPWLAFKSFSADSNAPGIVAEPISLLELRKTLEDLLLAVTAFSDAPDPDTPDFDTPDFDTPDFDPSGYAVGWTPQEEISQTTWICKALDLSDQQLKHVLTQLDGVVVNCSYQTSDAYRFNLREAILAVNLVPYPDQIYFLDDAIAAFLAEFHPDRQLAHPTLWHNSTIIIHTGLTSTDLGLVKVPDILENLTYKDFTQAYLAYGSQALDQDIVSQLLYPLLPPKRLNLEDFMFPPVGVESGHQRWQFQHQLMASPLGNLLIEAAAQLRQVLQSQKQFTLKIGDATHTFSRQDLHTKVTQPYIHQLNRALNHLLSRVGTVSEGITQVLLLGSLEMPADVLHWLHQKFPQARLIQDSLPRPTLTRENLPTPTQTTWSIQRIAYGLGTLPLYPQLLDTESQQYSDLFLLLELLRVFPDRPISFDRILRYLERRGINTRSCAPRVLSLLRGQLPTGFILDTVDQVYFDHNSWQQSHYKALRSSPLFSLQGDNLYAIDPVQRETFQTYWQAVTAHTVQTLEEPYSLQIENQYSFEI